MTGRVLSEEEVQCRLSQANGAVHSGVLTEAWRTEVQNLIATIYNLQAQQKELHRQYKRRVQQNAIMLSALERWASESIITPVYVDKALAQVEALNANEGRGTTPVLLKATSRMLID